MPRLNIAILKQQVVFDYCHVKQSVYHSKKSPVDMKLDLERIFRNFELNDPLKLGNLKILFPRKMSDSYLALQQGQAKLFTILDESGIAPVMPRETHEIWDLKGIQLPIATRVKASENLLDAEKKASKIIKHNSVENRRISYLIVGTLFRCCFSLMPRLYKILEAVPETA